MRIPIVLVATLLVLGGCGQTATTNGAAAANIVEANAIEPDITEVPDESADANEAAQDVDGDNETSGNARADSTANGAVAR